MNGVDPEVLLESILVIGEYIGDLTGTDSTDRRTGYAVNRSSIPIPQTNGMYVHGPEEAQALTDMPVLRDLFTTEGRPFGVTTIDGRTPAVERAAEELGLREVSVDVAMTLPREDFRASPTRALRMA